jgi:hypothetical protein
MYLCSPHEPELEDVVVPAALDALITGIPGSVVHLVLLKQVARLRAVGGLQNSLKGIKNRQSSMQNLLPN